MHRLAGDQGAVGGGADEDAAHAVEPPGGLAERVGPAAGAEQVVEEERVATAVGAGPLGDGDPAGRLPAALEQQLAALGARAGGGATCSGAALGSTATPKPPMTSSAASTAARSTTDSSMRPSVPLMLTR